MGNYSGYWSHNSTELDNEAYYLALMDHNSKFEFAYMTQDYFIGLHKISNTEVEIFYSKALRKIREEKLKNIENDYKI